LQGLFTSFAPHRLGTGCTILSQEKVLITHSWLVEPEESTREPSTMAGYRLLKIMMSDDDNAIICLGTRETRSELWLFTILIGHPRNKLEIRNAVKLPGLTYHNKVSMTLVQSDDQDQMTILVASSQGKVQQIKMRFDRAGLLRSSTF
jgi:hypothetical protein